MPRLRNQSLLRTTPLFTLLTMFFWSVAGLTNKGAWVRADAKAPLKSAEKGAISTVTYDVGDLVVLHPWPKGWIPGAQEQKVESIDALAQIIMTAIDGDNWDAKGSGNSLQELNGKQLEIRTSAKNHKAISELLTALRRLADVAVIVKSDLYEVDRGFYEKQIEPVLARSEGALEKPFAVVVEETVVKRLRDQGKLLRSNKVTIRDGQTEKTFSWGTAFNYQARPKSKVPKNSQHVRTAFHGMSFETGVNVTRDRRSVDLKLVQHTKELIEVGKELVADPATGDDVNIDVPNLLALSTSTTIHAEDGQAIVVPVHYRPAAGNKDGRLILLVRPVIYIEEEERAKKGGR